jgi:N utilization substance protein A
MITPPDGGEEVLSMFLSRVPALTSGTLEVMAMARERGRRCVFFVHSSDPAVDSVGTFIGERGVHVKAVVTALGQEHIDVVPWTDSMPQLIRNALWPLVLRDVILDEASRRATVAVEEMRSQDRPLDSLRLRLISRALGWEVQVAGIR